MERSRHHAEHGRPCCERDQDQGHVRPEERLRELAPVAEGRHHPSRRHERAAEQHRRRRDPDARRERSVARMQPGPLPN
jgi:broad specificity phosphatase PhoE